MKFGLTETEFVELHRQVVKPLKKLGANVWVFGSRGRGDHKPFSDIDLLYEGTISLSQLAHIKEDLENSNFPYKVDLVELNEVAESYKKQILQERQAV